MVAAKAGRVGVIGGGLGGLAAACTLAARGYAVTLFEKSPWLGGKAAILQEQGYRFDMGPTILTLPSVLRRLFAEAGKPLEQVLDLIRCDPQWRCFYHDGTTLDLVAEVETMARKLAAFAPGRSAQGYRDFLAWSERLHAISERFFFWKSIGSLWDMFDARSMFQAGTLLDVLKMRMGRSVASCVRSHVPDARVAQMLDHFTQYVGSSPDASPAVLCGIAHMQTQEGIWYPRGGTGAVPRALADLARSLGVQLRTGVGVTRILLDGNAVAGVETDTGEQIPCAAVVSNCDAVRTHRDLLAGTKAAAAFEKRRDYEPACSGVVLYLGLDRAYEHLAHHNFVFSRNAEEEFHTIYQEGKPAPDPTCYVAAPARSEAEVAPPGGEALYVLVHTPYLRPGQDWKLLFPDYRRTILRKLADTAGLTDLEGRIRFESHLTPQDIHDRYHVLNGAIYGLASHGTMFGAFKPGNLSRDIRGLYLAGGAAHPGPGMPMVLMSGWIAADTLDQDGIVQRSASSVLAAAPAVAPASVGRMANPSDGAVAPAAVSADALPRRSGWLVRLFTSYCRRYLGRNFHAVRLAAGTRPIDPAGPLVIVMNHPSWWDPLVGFVLAELLPGRAVYGPIDAMALGKYRFFERLGVFGVDQQGRQGGLTFLRRSLAVVAQPGTMLWVTGQGRFTDPRERPVRLKPGLGHLLRRLDNATLLPVAVEYPFWDERFPEVLTRFGTPLLVRGQEHTAEEWTQLAENALAATQDVLAVDALSRDPRRFETLVGGKVGVGGVYDLWRRLKALLRGHRFRAGHGDEETQAALGTP
jgi:diapolycopene oxygenase